tara:strand:- start:385 stop:678 length:294 start_codon:yes stop_codon:yes gene_type:complete
LFKPVNRYILVESPQEKQAETNSGIVLPDSFKPTEARHAVVTALDWAEDVRFKNKLAACSALGEKPTLVIDKSMLEEINVDGSRYNVILDNYIIGLL